MPIQTGYYWPIYDYPDEPDDFYTKGREECLVGSEEEEDEEYQEYLDGKRPDPRD